MLARLRESILDDEQRHQRADGFWQCLLRHLRHLRPLIRRHRRHGCRSTVFSYEVRQSPEHATLKRRWHRANEDAGGEALFFLTFLHPQSQLLHFVLHRRDQRDTCIRHPRCYYCCFEDLLNQRSADKSSTTASLSKHNVCGVYFEKRRRLLNALQELASVNTQAGQLLQLLHSDCYIHDKFARGLSEDNNEVALFFLTRGCVD